MFHPRGGSKRNCDLAIGDLSQRTGVLALDAHRVLALLGKSGVIDDQYIQWFQSQQRWQGVIHRVGANGVIRPGRRIAVVNQGVMKILANLGIPTRAELGDRLQALALQRAQQAQRVQGEVSSLLAALEMRSNAIEEIVEVLLGVAAVEGNGVLDIAPTSRCNCFSGGS